MMNPRRHTLSRPRLLLLFGALCLLAPGGLLRADIVQTKDGRVLQGEIISDTPEEVKIKVKLGTITVKRADVLKITRQEIDQFDDILRDLKAVLDYVKKGKPFTAQKMAKGIRERFPKSPFYKDARKQEDTFARLPLEGLPTEEGKPIRSLEDLLYSLELHTRDLCPDCEGCGLAKCPLCKGKGGAVCPTCEGSGGIKCKDCKGAGKVNCSVCSGTMKLACTRCPEQRDPNGNRKPGWVWDTRPDPSPYSSGKMKTGWWECEKCKTTLKTPCLSCGDERGNVCGKVKCGACDGHGAHACSGGCKDGVLEGQCTACHGAKTQPCPSCNGSGRRPGAAAEPKK